MENNTQIPGPENGLNEIIDAYTEEPNFGKYNPLRPSGAGKCEMQLGYEYMAFKGLAEPSKEDKSPSVQRLLDLGNPIESHTIYQMRKAFGKMDKPYKIKYQQQTVTICRLHDGTLLEGNIDLWVETDNWRCLADVKSKGDKYSQFYKSSWDEFVEKLVKTGHATKFGEDAVYITNLEEFLKEFSDAFFKDNLYQLNMYGCTDFAKERNITFCSILQYNKNDSRMREIRFVPTQSVADQRIEVFQRVAKTVDETKSVEGLTKEHVLGSTKCAFCPHNKKCWPEDDALKAFFNQLPAKQWAKDIGRLPTHVQAELNPLFEAHAEANLKASKLEQIEEKIVKLLDQNKIYKVKLTSGLIYRLKRLKDGIVLRRDKE